MVSAAQVIVIFVFIAAYIALNVMDYEIKCKSVPRYHQESSPKIKCDVSARWFR